MAESDKTPTPNTKPPLQINPETPPPVQNKKNNHARTTKLWAFTLFIVIIALAWYCYWIFYLQFHESTDDAYANGNMVYVNSVISGVVSAYYADDTDLVKEGQLLVELDRTNFQSIFDKELATLASVTLNVRQLYDNVQVSQAIVKNKKNELERTQFDYNNRLKLLKSNPEAVAQEDFVHAEHNFLAAQIDLQQAKSQLEYARAAAGNTPPESHPLIEQQKNSIRIAYYQLQHCSIFSPQTGYVAQRAVEVGSWITPTTSLMVIIPTDYIWVDANFKETELRNMRVGQPATVWFDIYGSSIQYNGKVVGIASGTGSVFSLIPPQNATGNWIKIVQRLPVRISLDPEVVKQYPVRLGISAEVDVDVSNTNLPFLSSIPPVKPVDHTYVFDIQMGKLDKLMDEIIKSNLQQNHSANHE